MLIVILFSFNRIEYFHVGAADEELPEMTEEIGKRV